MIRQLFLSLLFIFSLNSCALKDFMADYGENGYIKMIQHKLFTEFEYNCRLIGAMDKDVDTLGVFKVKLPPKVKKIRQDWNNFFFIYGKNKTVIIKIDYASRFNSKSFKQEDVNISNLKNCPYYVYGKNEEKVYPKNTESVSMSNSRYLKCGNTNIYIMGFKADEVKNLADTIMNSFTYLQWNNRTSVIDEAK